MKILAVVKEKFFSLQNLLVGIDANSVISIHHQNLHFTIGFRTVIGKSDLSTYPCSINAELIIDLEHVGTFGLVINLSSPLRFLLRNHFSDILRNELILVDNLARETSPARNITGSHVQLFPQFPLNHHISTTIRLRVKLQIAIETRETEIGITFPPRVATSTRVRCTFALTFTPGKPLITIRRTITKLFTKVSRLFTRARVLVTRLTRMMTRSVRKIILPLPVPTIALVQSCLFCFLGRFLLAPAFPAPSTCQIG